jgi:predicted alpha/beta superfamily hydrolase
MMRKLLCTLFLAALPAAAFCQVGDATGAPTYPHVVLGNTEMRPLHSAVTGRDYLLYIAYPDSYASHPERKYPVVYVTDGYWSFVKLSSLGSSLWYDQIVPEYIVVGLGYAGEHVNYGKERMYELSPTKQSYGWAKFAEVQGGSRKFLDAIKTEIIPYVETNTRADSSFRVMVGSSMGGLFSLFCMYEEPGLFQGIIAGSPEVDWDNRWLFRRECELRQAALGDDYKGVFHVPCRLFMGVGTGEVPDYVGSIEAFATIIRTGQYADFTFRFHPVEGERHGGNTAELFTRGLRFVFEPQMPSKVPPN